MLISGRLIAGLGLLAAGVAGTGGAEEVRSEMLEGLDFGRLAPREVRVYLPPGPVQEFTPILVALDGQNMGAWQLEEALKALAAEGRKELPLVVAVASGPDRLEEYGMAEHLDYAGRGRLAAEFQQFIVEAVLPAIRKRHGIAADRARTGVMGASLGGLAAFDLAWRHPGEFGFAGVFSGSFWWRAEDGTPAIRQTSRLAHRLVRTSPPRAGVPRFWFMAGTKEEMDDRDGNGVIDAVQDTTELIDELERAGWSRGSRLQYLKVEGGEHHEATWAAALPAFLAWALPER